MQTRTKMNSSNKIPGLFRKVKSYQEWFWVGGKTFNGP